MFTKKYVFLSLFVFLFFQFDEVKGQTGYDELRNYYKKINENDESALKYVYLYIQKATQEKNYAELKQGYEDYSYYSSNKSTKLKYADSALVVAKKANINSVLSSAYLYKGSLYYFYYKNYPSALTEYLNAYEYSKNDSDDYLRNKIVYQMGLVKGYLGQYEDALKHFNKCIAYFEPQTKENNNYPNKIYNNRKGYLNSLHQAIVCNQSIKNYKKADSLIKVGLNFTDKYDDFTSEKTYFIKSKGISDYHHGLYESVIQNLNNSLPILENNDDAYWISVSEFYIGKSLLKVNREDEAIQQFKKVDSIFQKREFIFPELSDNYKQLILYFQKKNDNKQELFYTKELAKIETILKRDYPMLSSKIHNGYDIQILTDIKDRLETTNKWRMGAILILCLIGAFLLFSLLKRSQNEKLIKQRYYDLEKKLQERDIEPIPISYDNISAEGKSVFNEDIFWGLQKKLQNFEKNEGFKEQELTLTKLSEKLDTNTSYLSRYINHTKGMNFNKYLSSLRINYITQQLYDNPDLMKLKIQGLANECGIGSRQNFSDAFQEINGIRPTDFIKQRRKELEEKEM